MSVKRPLSIAETKIVLRAGDLSRYGIHPQTISRAVRYGLLVKIDRGPSPNKVQTRTEGTSFRTNLPR